MVLKKAASYFTENVVGGFYFQTYNTLCITRVTLFRVVRTKSIDNFIIRLHASTCSLSIYSSVRNSIIIAIMTRFRTVLLNLLVYTGNCL